MAEDFFSMFDSGRVEGNEVVTRDRFPYAQIHNDKDGRGKEGGLFIKLADNAPDDLEVNPEVFKEKTLTFDDKITKEEFEEPGYLASDYSIVVLAYPKDDKKRPRGFRDPLARNPAEAKWLFPVLLAFKDAQSAKTPFKVVFKGQAAVRMSNLINQFNIHVVGKVSQLLKEQGKGPACINQFYMPVYHRREQLVGQDNKTSWGCPLQDFVEGTVREEVKQNPRTNKPYTQRSGVSVFKKYSDPDGLKLIKDLIVANGPNGKELVERYANWATTYADAVLPAVRNDRSGSSSFDNEGSAYANMSDFAADPTQLASDAQREFIFKLAKKAKSDVDETIQFLIGKGDLEVSEGEDSKTITFMQLSKKGASTLINYLKQDATPIIDNSDEPIKPKKSRLAAQAGADTGLPADAIADFE